MTAPVDLTVYRNEHQNRCIFCNEPEHVTTLLCPRVEGVDIDPSTGAIIGVRFFHEYQFDDWDNDPAA